VRDCVCLCVLEREHDCVFVCVRACDKDAVTATAYPAAFLSAGISIYP